MSLPRHSLPPTTHLPLTCTSAPTVTEVCLPLPCHPTLLPIKLLLSGSSGPNKRRREIEFDLDGDALESKMVRMGEASHPIDRQLKDACHLVLQEAEKDREKVIQLICEW